MRHHRRFFMSLSVSALGALISSSALPAQVPAANPGISDWSAHHIVFSRPAPGENAWRVERDRRYRQQIARQSPAMLPGEIRKNGPVAVSPFDASAALIGGTNGNAGDWSQDMGSGATVGATNYPAKYSFNIKIASCSSDFAVFGTGLAGGINQANIVAFNNLYSGCTGTVPSVYWAFNTGGTVVTSPVFSRDGTQVAFVQTGGGYPSTLVLLRWAASTIETIINPLTLTRVTRAAYPACIAPCFTSIPLRNLVGGHNKDSNSSVFYDYDNDVAYVGDDDGVLHQFTPVFKGVPGGILTGGWPIQVNAITPTALTSPVHDFVTGNVFVSDTGGFLYQVNPVTAAVTVSGQLDFSLANDGGPGIVQAPIADPSAGLVYVFATSDGTGGCSGGADCTGLYELSTSFLAGDTGTETVVGASTVAPTQPNPFYIGAFDSTYQNSVNATGNLYVCGNTGGPPVIYQVPITAGAFGTVNNGPVISTSITIPCSPLTDVYNPNAAGGATEWIFASTQNGGASAACVSGGCLFNFKDTPWQSSTAYSLGQEVLDTHFQIQVVTKAGTSGATAPSWQTIVGRTTNDGGVHWLNQGRQSAFTPGAWAPLHTYAKGNTILDAGKNIQLVTTAGKSGGSIPAFNGTAGGTTADGTVTWTNAGGLATAAVPEAGGTSGMIIDNVVGSGIQPGASNIYFSTLTDQTCGTSGSGGCAIQASQAALQ